MAVGYLPTNFRLQGKNNCLSWAFSTFTFSRGSFQFPFTPAHTYTHTHAHTQTHNIAIHTDTRVTHIQPHRHMHTHAYMCSHRHVRAHSPSPACASRGPANPFLMLFLCLRELGEQSLKLWLGRYFSCSGEVPHVHHTSSFDKLTRASASKRSSLRINT